MAVNPMQRKAKNSFLLGVVITLLISGLIIGLMLMELNKVKKEQQEKEASLKPVYVTTREIKSGETVKPDDFKTVQVDKSAIPSDAITTANINLLMIERQQTDGTIKDEYPASAKVAIQPNTIVTTEMLNILDNSESQVSNDLRLEEYNMIVLPTQLEDMEFIDVRLQLPSGQNYLVVSKKQVQVPVVAGVPSTSTILLKMKEEEILLMSNAIVEAYLIPGAKLYATRYVEPGLQTTAIPTYIPSGEVVNLINSDPNVTQEARSELSARYTATAEQVRPDIQQQVNATKTENEMRDVITKIQEETKKAADERKSYLDSLAE